MRAARSRDTARRTETQSHGRGLSFFEYHILEPLAKPLGLWSRHDVPQAFWPTNLEEMFTDTDRDRQTDSQAGRQADRQTDRQTHTHTHTQTDRDTQTHTRTDLPLAKQALSHGPHLRSRR